MTDSQYKALSKWEFDKAAEKFDDSDLSVYNMCRKDYPEVLEELKREPFHDVLDAGCGTGAVVALLAQACPHGHYTGIDLSPKMIEIARQKHVQNVSFVEGDCEQLPFSKDSYDAVLCSQSFHHYPNPEKFFINVARVLRPGGRLILRDMTGPRWAQFLFNHVEIPLLNLFFQKGDVHVYVQEEMEQLCFQSGLQLERFERRKGLRMHCVCRKPKIC